MRGAEMRMGWVSQQNKPFGKGVIGDRCALGAGRGRNAGTPR